MDSYKYYRILSSVKNYTNYDEYLNMHQCTTHTILTDKEQKKKYGEILVENDARVKYQCVGETKPTKDYRFVHDYYLDKDFNVLGSYYIQVPKENIKLDN